MVSTRGIKLKFFVGERVLCYEPDPSKAKVLYDSKVLDIVIKKDQTGRKVVEYLIHFQGWNSSWDRCVAEDYVLKDTAENRQLQKDLAQKAQLQLGSYLYRKERKKQRNSCDSLISTSEIASSSSSNEYSSEEEDHIDIELTPELRKVVENDYYFVKERNKVLRLPAVPNVVTILELYYKHATNHIYDLDEKSILRKSCFNCKNNVKLKPEHVQRNLHICKEVIDSLRICFDFTLNDLLLYATEKRRFETSVATAQLISRENLFGSCSSNSETSNALSWTLLPEYTYHQQPAPPSLIYGATHLLRLFVKLPELLTASNIPEMKLRVLLHHFDFIIDFLTDHKEWFGEKYYEDA